MHNPPVPVSATFSAPPALQVVVTFDVDLQPGVSQIFEWVVDAANPAPQSGWKSLVPHIVSGKTVTSDVVNIGGAPGPDSVQYFQAPGDLFGLESGLPVAAFTIPIVIVP